MRAMGLQEVVSVLNAAIAPGGADVRGEIAGVGIDSRTVGRGDCFFAIAGDRFDGHDFVADVFERGVACAVVGRDVDVEVPGGKVLLKVADTVGALGDLARHYRKSGGFKVVAITGSAGKTTTRQIAAHVLGRHFHVHQSPRSFNNAIGVPLTLLGAEAEHEIVVAELGTNHPGEIAELTRIALPDVAVVTNVHPAHLEGFGSLDAIAKEKTSIAEGLRSGGTFIVNGDIARLLKAARGKFERLRTFGCKADCDYRAGRVRCEGETSRFEINGREITLGLAGRGNVENALAAWAICAECGLNVEQFAGALESMPAVAMRAEMLQLGPIRVLNDCYNANPASMRNALEILGGLAPAGGGGRVFICGDMAELGGQAEQLHRELAADIVNAEVEVLAAVGPLSAVAAERAEALAESSGRGPMHVRYFESAAAACNNVHDLVGNGDIILVKGSRSAGLEVLVEKLKDRFPQTVAESQA